MAIRPGNATFARRRASPLRALYVIIRCTAQIERALAIAEDPARLRRIEARSEIIAARNIRIAERERVRREAIARQAAERAVAEAAEAAAQAARKAEEVREAKRVEQPRRDAAAAAEREEALLAIRRAGRKKKKRKGH